MQTCRFCKSWKNEDQMVKYGVRHYAHFTCYLDGGKALDDLHAWQVSQFPFRLLKKRGLLEKARTLAGNENPISGELLED
jgi:hypothetical protein